MSKFLPITPKEIKALGVETPDFVLVTGDAYVDHPSFGAAVIGRVLERLGFVVAVMAQPKLSVDTFRQFGKPTCGFLVTGGNIDSMVANYTVGGKKRNRDAYSPGEKNGRPDRAVVTYSRLARKAYPDLPIILGGIEASLRRFAHYDYWSDSVMQSILCDAEADMIVFGMGESQIRAVAERLRGGEPVDSITDIRGTTVYITPDKIPSGAVSCPSFEKMRDDKDTYVKATALIMGEQDPVSGRAVVQKNGDRLVLHNRPAPPLTTEELDDVFTLPFARMYHPSYEAVGGVKAIQEVEFSIIHNRGCFGGCSFCCITMHQGRHISVRSHESVIKEAEDFVKNPRFKGYVHDVGGATANFRVPPCEKQKKHGNCKNKLCLGTSPCPNLKADHSDYLELLRSLRDIKGIKKVFVRSGLRYDYMLKDKDETFLKELVEHHVSGQLKIAPEHCAMEVLSQMGKPSIDVYKRFVNRYFKLSSDVGKEQYVVPYLMSSHPGSSLKSALTLSLFLRDNRLKPEQVQDFYPTPGTVSTCIFHTGVSPVTMKKVYVPKTQQEKQLQRALLQYYKPENYTLVEKALVSLDRRDLIGTDAKCLIRPRGGSATARRTDVRSEGSGRATRKSGETSADSRRKKECSKKRDNKGGKSRHKR